MQGAKTSKTMFPRVGTAYIYTNHLVSKRSSNKSKQIKTIILKLIPKISKQQLKHYQQMMRINIRKNHPKHAKLSDVGSRLGAFCLRVSASARFVFDLFFGTSGGYPLGPMLVSPGAPLVRCCILFGRFQDPINSKFQRFQSNKLHQPHLKKKQAKISKHLYRTPIQANHLLLLFNKGA